MPVQFLFTFATAVVLLGAGCANQAPIIPQATKTVGTGPVIVGPRLDLSGQGLTAVPSDVFKRTDLVELDVSRNRLKGALPAEIRMLTKLKTLDASDNAMTGVPAEIGQLRDLTTLDLSGNQLTGLPLELGNLTNLRTLDLRGNPSVSKYDLGIIGKTLSNTLILVD